MQILSRYDLFIFDWDQTLVQSTLLLKILTPILGRLRGRSRVRYRQVHMPEKAIRNIKVDESFSRFYAAFDDIYSVVFKPKLKPGAAQLLEFLKKNGKKVAIFSDSKTYRLLKETSSLGLLRYVDFALSAESIDYYKPDPTGLLILVDRFGMAKKRCLYIGDMASDVLTARLAEMDACGVADGVDPYGTLKRANPKYLFTNVESFAKAMGKK
jgi:HAD superfamily hydrolase (TIGR01509 family)